MARCPHGYAYGDTQLCLTLCVLLRKASDHRFTVNRGLLDASCVNADLNDPITATYSPSVTNYGQAGEKYVIVEV